MALTENLNSAFAGIAVRCCPPGEGCECSDVERVLRGYAYGSSGPMPPMTEVQRAACLDEIAAVEGNKRADWEDSPDEQLASGVLSAWHDYCLDKGLI